MNTASLAATAGQTPEALRDARHAFAAQRIRKTGIAGSTGWRMPTEGMRVR